MADVRKGGSGVYLGAVSAIFGLVILYLAGGEAGVPERAALASAAGPVQSVVKGKSSVRFSLKGDARHFQHLSKSGAFPLAYDALSRAGNEAVTVLFDPAQDWQPAFDDKTYHTVYEIRISGRTVLGYEQARDAWEADRGLGNALGLVFLLAGAGMMIFARHR